MKPRGSARLNAVCPYFTMFPLGFPLALLAGRARPGDWVLDPFAGRGTTNYAARLLGLSSVGIDSSPVAVAVTQAKLANTTPAAVLACAERILETTPPAELPRGEFWSLAFEETTLDAICRLRSALLDDCRSDARKALRAIVMGALHGPRTKSTPSYLSNQCTRTYAPKPDYAVRFWRSRNLKPPVVSARQVIRVRSERYYADQVRATGRVIAGDSRRSSTFRSVRERRAKWIVTSPPYYGMRTYIPDQWLRHWFVGGPSHVDYSNYGQLAHASPEGFAAQLTEVWINVASIATDDARLVIRFGGIFDRAADPLDILKHSLKGSPWALSTVRSAGSADLGKRQAIHFATTRNGAIAEHDAFARLA